LPTCKTWTNWRPPENQQAFQSRASVFL
jgi:hypothetical protein